jgi:opacity protein-like surface antigen
MTTRGLAASVVVAVLLVPGMASAQAQYVSQPDSPEWLKDRRYNEGIGIRTGDLELHPGIAAEAGYDSNYLLRSTTENVSNGPPGAPVIPALEFRITPSLYLSTLGVQRREGDSGGTSPLAFRAGFNLTYRELVGLSSDSSAPNNDISGQRNASGAADARLDILPERPVGGAVFASYARAILPNTVNANPDVSFNQDVVGGGAEIAVQPGSGTLDWHVGYQLHATIFEEAAGKPYDNIAHEVYTRGRWKFRPRTAFVYDATLRFISYENSDLAVPVPLDTSTPVRARIGLDGLVTDRFALLAMVGWGASFYDTTLPKQPQFDSVIAQAELRWFLSASPGVASVTDVGLALSSIALGYTRDFQNSYLGSYYTQDRGYLKFYYLFAGRATITLEGGVAAIEYPTLFWADSTERNPSFTDLRADATLFGEYRFTDTFGLNATFRYSSNVSKTLLDVSEPAAGTAPPAKYAMQWQRFEAYLGLRWFM